MKAYDLTPHYKRFKFCLYIYVVLLTSVMLYEYSEEQGLI